MWGSKCSIGLKLIFLPQSNVDSYSYLNIHTNYLCQKKTRKKKHIKKSKENIDKPNHSHLYIINVIIHNIDKRDENDALKKNVKKI